MQVCRVHSTGYEEVDYKKARHSSQIDLIHDVSGMEPFFICFLSFRLIPKGL